MSEMTWGDTLWDQWDKILDHTKGGLEFTEKCHAFTRDRIKLEAEYVKNLRRLKRTYKLKNAEDDAASYSTLEAFTVILDQVDLIAREHEMMAEKLSERVGDKLKQLHRDCTNTRKNLMHSASQMQTEYKDWQSSLERLQQKYEKSAKDADIASQAFTRVNEDMNATKAQVEKSRLHMVHKQDLMERCKGEYIIQVETTNNNQHDYYRQRFPEILNQMQHCEEGRVEQIGHLLTESCQLHADIIPHVTESLTNMVSSCNNINPVEDSALLMEERTNNPYPSDHQFIEYGCKPQPTSSFGQHNESIRKKREKKKTKIWGRMVAGDSTDGVDRDGYQHLPPEKRKKAFKKKIKEIQDKIDVQLKARTGVEDILELYSKKPELGNDKAIEESRQQLDMIAAELEKLHTELHTYQCYLSTLNNMPAPEKPAIGSHLTSHGDGISISSSISHASHSAEADPIVDNGGETEFGVVAPSPGADSNTNEFNTINSYYEMPDQPPPVPPTPEGGQLCSVLYDYTAQHDDELDIYQGEYLFIMEDNGTGWVKAQRNDNEKGLIPGNYIEMMAS